MRRHLFLLISLLAVLFLFSGCVTYPASTTTASTAIPISATPNPAKKTLSLPASELIQLFYSAGIPVHIANSTAKELSFTDERLASYSVKENGKLLIFSTNQEAYSQYKTLLSNNKTSQYIYQNRNILLVLSNQFTKAQATQYKGIFSIAGDFSDSGSNTSSNHQISVSQTTPASSPSPSPDHTIFKEGTYVIGSVLPAGEYVINSFGGRCKVSLTEETGKKHTIFNNSFSHNIILTVRTKEVLTIDGGTATLLSNCDYLDASKEGMFKVGTHLDAGTYTLSLSDNNIIGFGNVQIMKDSRFDEDSILSAQLFTSPLSITLKEGEYIKVSGAHIT